MQMWPASCFQGPQSLVEGDGAEPATHAPWPGARVELAVPSTGVSRTGAGRATLPRHKRELGFPKEGARRVEQ